MVGLDNNFIFIHIPRTSGTSIESVLLKYTNDLERADGARYLIPEVKVANRIAHSPKSSFQVDTYKHYTAKEINMLFPERYETMKTFSIIRNPIDKYLSVFGFWKAPVENGDIQHYCKNNIESIGEGWLFFQKPYLVKDNEIIVDKVICPEDLDSEGEGLLEWLGVKYEERPYINKSDFTNKYKHSISKEDTEFLQNFFKEDFELWEQYKK